MATVVKQLPDRLRQARADAQESRESAALAIDRTATTIRAYECGRATPPVKTLERLARFYGVELADLLPADPSARGAEYVERVAASAPTLTAEQIDRLRAILRPTGGAP